jgi:glycerophosphoryl diester phosphodiesterase
MIVVFISMTKCNELVVFHAETLCKQLTNLGHRFCIDFSPTGNEKAEKPNCGFSIRRFTAFAAFVLPFFEIQKCFLSPFSCLESLLSK